MYHGTIAGFLDAIRSNGLQKRGRHHVHLSRDFDAACQVGRRRGAPIILKIEAGRMHTDGVVFFLSDNGIWLTDHVPAEYIRFPDERSRR